ncbi:hypothetical protein [Streptomyces sp. NPDC001135]
MNALYGLVAEGADLQTAVGQVAGWPAWSPSRRQVAAGPGREE